MRREIPPIAATVRRARLPQLAAGVVAAVALGAVPAVAQTLELLHSFNDREASPRADLVQAADGWFYATTSSDGEHGAGTLYRFGATGTVEVLHHFDWNDGGNGAHAWAGVIEGGDGWFYGTTLYGGANGAGTLYRWSPGGGFEMLHSFDFGAGGAHPYAPLLRASDGAFYGTTFYGGEYGAGTAFRFTPGATPSVLHSFQWSSSDGTHPTAGLVEAADGWFYGTTSQGGDNGRGTIYRVGASGAFELVHTFDGYDDSDCHDYGWCSSDGADPYGELLAASDGKLYGTTLHGGNHGHGTVYRLEDDGTVTVLHDLQGADGMHPYSRLAEGPGGFFYGTTANGGAHGAGVAFRVPPTGGAEVLHSFQWNGGEGGSHPIAGLTVGSDGRLYGQTQQGGASNGGAAYALSTGGVFTLLASLGNLDAADPRSELFEASDGWLYGTTVGGGESNDGTLYRTDRLGNVEILHSFRWASDNGASPYGGVTEGTGGTLYGTTMHGGAHGTGTVYRWAPGGSFTVLHSFSHWNDANDGAYPASTLLDAGDGWLYGTTQQGGAAGTGTVFRLDPTGAAFEVVHSFQDGAAGNGAYPWAGLVLGNDGALYGTTIHGGAFDYGTIFRLELGGPLTVLHGFDPASDGAFPYSRLLHASDGALYGTAHAAGPGGAGTVFRLGSAGFEVLRSFTSTFGSGGHPFAGLVEASDGRLYGTTTDGGSSAGTVFRLAVNGSFEQLHQLAWLDGAHPYAELIQASDGNLYGTTESGGEVGQGTIFRILLDRAPAGLTLTPGAAVVDEGSPFALAGSFTDPDAGQAHTVTIRWGDGSAATVLSLAAGVVDFDASHTYADDDPTATPADPYAVAVTVSDSAASTTAGTSVTVRNVAPVVNGLAAPSAPARLGGAITATASYADAGVADTHGCAFTWGDGGGDAAPAAGGSCNARHTYAAAGVYTVVVTVSDDDGGETAATYRHVVVYDPTGGFLTGGGWITSPVGAVRARPALTGRASFSFVSRYERGSPVPTGETRFEVAAAGLSFRSTAHEWLVIAGAKVRYEGAGTINGAGDYGFRLTAVDGGKRKGGDRFRIEIWDRALGNVVYDSEPGRAADDAPATALGGGSIVVHSGK